MFLMKTVLMFICVYSEKIYVFICLPTCRNIFLRSSIGHTLSSNTSHVGLSSRSIDGSISRTGNSHSSSITIAKPVNISQPIVQHLQQQVRIHIF